MTVDVSVILNPQGADVIVGKDPTQQVVLVDVAVPPPVVLVEASAAQGPPGPQGPAGPELPPPGVADVGKVGIIRNNGPGPVWRADFFHPADMVGDDYRPRNLQAKEVIGGPAGEMAMAVEPGLGQRFYFDRTRATYWQWNFATTSLEYRDDLADPAGPLFSVGVTGDGWFKGNVTVRNLYANYLEVASSAKITGLLTVPQIRFQSAPDLLLYGQAGTSRMAYTVGGVEAFGVSPTALNAAGSGTFKGDLITGAAGDLRLMSDATTSTLMLRNANPQAFLRFNNTTNNLQLTLNGAWAATYAPGGHLTINGNLAVYGSQITLGGAAAIYQLSGDAAASNVVFNTTAGLPYAYLQYSVAGKSLVYYANGNSQFTIDAAGNAAFRGALTAGSIVPSDLSVTTAKLADGSVTNPKLAANAVTGVKVASDTLDSSKWQPSQWFMTRNLAGFAFYTGATFTAAGNRWNMYPNGVEAAGNVGNDFTFQSQDNAGAYLSSPLVIRRSDGMLINTGGLYTNGSVSGPTHVVRGGSVNYTSLAGTSNRWITQVGGGEAAGNVGADFLLSGFANDGAFLRTDMTIRRTDGAVTFSGFVGAGALSATNYVIATGYNTRLGNAASLVSDANSTVLYFDAANGSYINLPYASGTLQYVYRNATRFIIDGPTGLARVYGVTEIRPTGGTGGYITLAPGDATRSGYTEYRVPDGSRGGYIGYSEPVSRVNVIAHDAGYVWRFTGGSMPQGPDGSPLGLARLNVKYYGQDSWIEAAMCGGIQVAQAGCTLFVCTAPASQAGIVDGYRVKVANHRGSPITLWQDAGTSLYWCNNAGTIVGGHRTLGHGALVDVVYVGGLWMVSGSGIS